MSRDLDEADGTTPRGNGPPSDAAARREARLAVALRANLRKRKDQLRERGKADTPTQEPPSPRDPGRDVL